MCSSPALIYGGHRVLNDERLIGLWPQQPRECVKDLKDVLKQRLGMATSPHHYCNNEIQCELLREQADLRVGVDVKVAFCFWEKKDAHAAVDDATDDAAVCQSKFWGQSLSALQQILDEFFLQKREKHAFGLSVDLSQRSILPLTYFFSPVYVTNMNILTMLSAVGSPTVVSIRRSSSSVFCLSRQHLWTFCRTNTTAKNGLDVFRAHK